MRLLVALLLGLLPTALAQFRVIPFNNTRPVGPDGPWLPVTLGTGQPLQFMDFYPTFNASTNWFVAKANCHNANQSCPENAQYYDSTLWSALNNPELSLMRNSSAVSFEDINGPTAKLLGADDSYGYWHAESFALFANKDNPDFYFAGGLSQITSNYTNIKFPNGASYVPLSLFTLDPTVLDLPKGPKFSATEVTLLVDLLNTTDIASSSWAMHIGSYSQAINGSLVIGGYDQTRVVGTPGALPSNGVSLASISIGASTGGYNWTNLVLTKNYLDGQILDVSLTPSVPYLYLPASACEALADDLPISFNEGLNLYVWETNNASYSDIVTSPSWLNFTFKSQDTSGPISIRVPFALLNLTLEPPLVNSPINYFPCSPSDASFYALGRAFLQAAFIGQNYNSSTFWLGQAPGPNGLGAGSNIKVLYPSDTAIVPSPGGKTFEQSWEGVLKPISSSSTAAPSAGSSALSNGAIAGIVVGVIVPVACALVFVIMWLMRRRSRNRRSAETQKRTIEKSEAWTAPDKKVANPTMLAEAPSYSVASELPDKSHCTAEVPGNNIAVELGRGRSH